MAQQQAARLRRVQSLKLFQEGQVNRGAKRMCDVLILDAPKLEVSLEGAKDSRPANSLLEVPRKRGHGCLWTSPPQNVTWKQGSYASANSVLGAPRGSGESRPDLFVGRPRDSIPAKGTAGAIFEIVEAPVRSVEGTKVPGIVFTNSGSNMTSSLTTLPSNYSWKEPATRSV